MLENNNSQIKDLASACGFSLINPEPNPWMISFKKEENPIARINIYWTTMTVTVQYKGGRRMKTFRRVSLSQLEDILQDIQ